MKNVLIATLLMLSACFTVQADNLPYSAVIEQVDKEGGNFINMKGKKYLVSPKTVIRYHGQILPASRLSKGLEVRYSLAHDGVANSIGEMEVISRNDELFPPH